VNAGLTSGTLKLIAISSKQGEGKAENSKILPEKVFDG
jgi:hypothetical protein